MRIALVDYGAGNLHSCAKALMRALDHAGLVGEVVVGSDPAIVARADHIVLPGDGAFRDCRRSLATVDGLEAALQEAVLARGRPFLGICVGMQLLADIGEEHGETAGLGWIGGRVKKLAPAGLKVPHMGWNTLRAAGSHAVLAGIPLGEAGLHAYFLHGYHLLPAESRDLLAVADYGGPVSAIVGRDTIVGTQFHPEKSQRLGLALLSNFLRWRP